VSSNRYDESQTHSLAVYVGASVGSLTPVAGEHSMLPNLEFNVRAGTTIRIVVDAGPGATGFVRLSLSGEPVNDRFVTPQPIAGTSGSFKGNNEGASGEQGEPFHAGMEYGKASVWYRWIAPGSGLTRFTVLGSFDTVLAAYQGSGLSSLTAQASNDSCADAPGNQDSCIRFFATKGQAYYIAVDGPYYAQGDFSLSWRLTATQCTVRGTTAADVLTGTASDDVICGLGGNDTIRSSLGHDVIVGGPGSDTMDYSTSPSAVIANLALASSSGPADATLQTVESLAGSPHPDTLDGDADANTIRGNGGDDRLWGQAGEDGLYGDAGDDTLGPSDGADTADGGAGVDLVHYGRAVSVTVDLTAGTATGQGADKLMNLEDIWGSTGADRLTGSGAPNRITANGGNDIIKGLGSADALYGGYGADNLDGGAATDSCDGGFGADVAIACESRVSIP
jgi:Ca2+-binding RTX toxin-like protein